MKVAIVTSYPSDPKAPHGGVEAVSVNLVKGLSKLEGMEIHVVTADKNIRDIEITKNGNVCIHRFPQAQMKTLQYAIGAGRREIKKYLKELSPDVVHSHDTYGLMVVGLDIPRVFTVHGFIYEDTCYGGDKLAKFRSYVWRIFETNGWKDQPHIISISPYVHKRLNGVVKGAIHDINNPVSGEFFEIKRNEEKGVIFSSATICPRKNTIALLEAVSIVVKEGISVRLRLAGSVTDQAYMDAVNKYVREHGLNEYVIFLGKINSDEIKNELSRASIYALVSFEENAPMGIEEAMAAGVPVVASNKCGMPYMVEDARSGALVDPKDPSNIAKALIKILSDDQLRRSMGNRSKELAIENFHFDKIAEKTLKVYQEAMKTHKQGG